MREGFTAVLGGDIAAKVFTAGFVVLAIRQLPVATFASYTYLSSLVILAYTIVSGVFNRQFLLLSPSLCNERRFRNLQIGATALVFVGCTLLFRPSASVLGLLAAFICAMAAASYDFHRTATQKRQRFGTYASIEVARTLIMLSLGLLILVVPTVHQVEVLFAAQALSYVLIGFVLRLQPRPNEPAAGYAAIIGQFVGAAGLWIIAYWLLVAVVGQAPLLLLARLGDAATLAALGSAMRYYGIALSVVVAVNVVVLPHLSGGDTPAEVFRRMGESARLLLFAMAIVIVGAVMGYALIPFIDGGKYPEAPVLFVLLCLGLFPGIVMAPISSALLRLDRTGDMVLAMTAGLVVTVIITAATRSAIGAAAAVPAGTIGQLLVGIAALHRTRGRINLSRMTG